jgi:hypothetical protein
VVKGKSTAKAGIRSHGVSRDTLLCLLPCLSTPPPPRLIRRHMRNIVITNIVSCDINDKLPTNALQFFIIHIKLLHVSASNGHLEGAVHILQKHQIDILQCRLYLSGPDTVKIVIRIK